MSLLRVALIQLRTPADQDAALAQAEPLIREAAAQGAQLILTPEGSNLLQRNRAKLMGVIKPLDQDSFVARMRALALELKIPILIGSALVALPAGEGAEVKAANRSVLIDEAGVVVQTYDKVHMFDVDLPNGDRYRESALYTPGEAAALAQVAGAVLGLTICYDIRFPYLHRALAQAGAQIITVPAAFTAPTGEAHWEVLLRARAIETGAFVLAPAQGGLHEDGRETWGRTTVVDPWGAVIAKLDHDAPGVLMADLDLDAVDKARAAIPALVKDRSFSAPAL